MPRVFISYSHDSDEHRNRVLELSERLRSDGVDARLDQYEEHKGHNWPDWCDEQLEKADLVLMVCTPEYRAAIEGRAPEGARKGVCWEADRIKQEIYDNQCNKERFVPVFFDGASREEDVPIRIRSVSRFDPTDPAGYEGLFGRITGQPRVHMHKLGLLRSLPSLIVPLREEQDPEKYLAWLRGETGRVELERLLDSPDQLPPPAIDTLYISLDTRAGGAGRERMEPGVSTALENILHNRKVVIEGEPGSGKTTFLRRIAWALCRKDRTNEQLILPVNGFPLFVRMYRLDEHINATLAAREGGDPSTEDDPRWIAHYLAHQGWGLNEKFFHDKLCQPDSVLLMDGLDEASSEARRAELVELLLNAAGQYECRFVVSTRPGAHQRKATLRDFQRAWIEPLKADAIDRFLQVWSSWLKRGEETAAHAHYQSLRKAVERATLRHLAGNPLMLTALAVVHYKNRVLPEQRADLYEEIMQWLGAQAESRSVKHRYRKDDFLRWLGHLALTMQTAKGGQKLEVSVGRGATLLKEKFHDEPALPAEEAASQFLECAHWSCGIVTLRSNKLVFWHRTFQEYLAARALSMIGEAKRWQHVRKLAYLEEGRETLPLLAGRMMTVSPEPLAELFEALIQDATGKAELAPRVMAFAILSRMLEDLASTRFRLPAPAEQGYSRLRTSVLEIFEKGKSHEIGIEVLVSAAEALGTAIPCLRTPRHKDYWVPLDGGAFTMGAQKSDPGDSLTYDPAAENDEPLRRVAIRAFQMGRNPVTVWEYDKFLGEAAATEPQLIPHEWEEQLRHPGRPVVQVTWNQARRYCHWFNCNLPTEEQWEFAARGSEGRKYPWGNPAPDETRAFFNDRIDHPAVVGLLSDGDTREGVCGLAGNVWEWTVSDYEKDSEAKVVRGGAFDDVAGALRAAYRVWGRPVDCYGYIGFRCVRE
jgi:formylglycine-generating enzyme required for sulfatase activity